MRIDKIENYLSTHDAAGNLVAYWEQKATIWSKLSQVAKCLLSVPAASTSSERSFSLAGRTIDDRRCQLGTDTVDGLMFLHGLKKM